MVSSRMVYVFLVVVFSTQLFGAFEPKKTKRSSSVFSSPYDGRFISVIVSSYASHRRLCGSNQQLGVDTFDYSKECCEKKDNQCISERQCRRPVATCVYVREDGSKDYYKSSGVKDCGQCVAKDLEDPAEVISSFDY